MIRIQINPSVYDIQQLVAALNIKSNLRYLFELAVEDHNSRIDTTLSFQAGYLESVIEYFVDGAFQNEFVPSDETGFAAFAELRLGDVSVTTRLWPNNYARAEYEFKVIYNIGSRTEDVVVEFRLIVNSNAEITRVDMLCDESVRKSKYLTKWLLST